VKLSLSDVHVSLGGTHILWGISLEAAPGTVTALIGPNGAGKSTLLRSVIGLVPYHGQVVLDATDARAIDPQALSQVAAYLPQDLQARSRLTVLEVALIGKLGTLHWHVPDVEVEQAPESLANTGIEHLAARPITELSLGQRQLAFIAQALVRNPSLLLLDEPTSALDLRHQLEILGLIRRIVAERQATALVALHDLNLAARFADRLVLLADGRVYGAGQPAEVLTERTIRDAYGVEAEVARRTDGLTSITPVRPVPA
jgi:iron complex transport system ATP-binding protein